MLHYTDDASYKAISSQPIWQFKASKPPGNRAFGAYFTTLPPKTPRLAARLRIPKRKLEYVFNFTGNSGLQPLEGDRGAFIFWSPVDYNVEVDRQVYDGRSEEMP
jgi:hypothetical protein